uniref:Putative capsid morphogenesis protein n=1 Tax=viral metagenome TaxID=1070528 RepID=A0A6H1ZNS5_9ZZZZ
MLLARVRKLRAIVEGEVLPALQAEAPKVEETTAPERTDDASSAAARAVFSALSRSKIRWAAEEKRTSGQLDLFLDDTVKSVDAVGKRGLAGQIKAVLGLDPLLREPFLATQMVLFRETNVALIKTIAQQHFSEIEGIVGRGLAAGTRPETMAKDIEARYEVSRSRARLIARDQVAKLHGQLDRLRQQEAGITRYVWRTSKDERVRSTHAERDGQTYEWADPPGNMDDPADGGHPGTPIQCRCTAEPVLSDLLD